MIGHWKSIPGHFNFSDLYMKAVEHADEGAVFVELGVWKGQSAAFMIETIMNSGKYIKFYCVDTWNPPPHAGPGLLEDEDVVNDRLYESFLNYMKPYEGHYHPIISDATDAALFFQDDSVDFIFVDADHETEAVKSDILAWTPKMKSHGVITGHDIKGQEVQSALTDLKLEWKWYGENSFYIVNPNGFITW